MATTTGVVELTLTRLERRLHATMDQAKTYRLQPAVREQERAEFVARCKAHLDHAARVIDAELEAVA